MHTFCNICLYCPLCTERTKYKKKKMRKIRHPLGLLKQTQRLKRTFAASVAHRNPARFILAWTLSSNCRSWPPPLISPLLLTVCPLHIVVAFYCFILVILWLRCFHSPLLPALFFGWLCAVVTGFCLNFSVARTNYA